MMFKGLCRLVQLHLVTKSAGTTFSRRYPRLQHDPRGTLLRYDFQIRISVCIWPLFISTSTHTYIYFCFYIKYPNMSASKMAEELSRRHPLQRLQSPSRGISAVLHVRTLTFCLRILLLRIFLLRNLTQK